MRWPFVSRARYELLEHNYAEARKLAKDGVSVAEAHSASLGVMLDRAAIAYNELLDKYHFLRIEGANAPWQSPAPESSFGPLTRAALNDMGKGQSGMIRRAMRAKAEQLWAENRGESEVDTIVATLVRAGEQLAFG